MRSRSRLYSVVASRSAAAASRMMIGSSTPVRMPAGEPATVCPVLRIRTFVAIAMTLAGVAGLAACDSSSASKPTSGLEAVLKLAPQNATSVLFTQWSAFGNVDDPKSPRMAGELAGYDQLIRSDL